ncbi:hypothetical protein M405DRAFT_824877 [Rhizopogon salebrosus TDB-379]|nr:hypothetical protein M405DRAFT_824877 [Rhizopogon salebrosus TDB-379]
MICCQHLPFTTNPHSCTLLSPLSLAVSYSSTIFSSIPPPAKLARVVIAHSHKLSVNITKGSQTASPRGFTTSPFK